MDVGAAYYYIWNDDIDSPVFDFSLIILLEVTPGALNPLSTGRTLRRQFGGIYH